tara:strand:- start:593 stop:793 length:201 start_codon:yes stop_codon:yes gene_type:complete
VTKEISQWLIAFGGGLERWHFFVSQPHHLAQSILLPYQEKKINKNLTGYHVESLFYIMLEAPKEKL